MNVQGNNKSILSSSGENAASLEEEDSSKSNRKDKCADEKSEGAPE